MIRLSARDRRLVARVIADSGVIYSLTTARRHLNEGRVQHVDSWLELVEWRLRRLAGEPEPTLPDDDEDGAE